MKIYYHLSSYVSHQIAGLEYLRLFEGLGHTLYCNFERDWQAGAEEGGRFCQPLTSQLPRREVAERAREADLVILHDDPLLYPEILAELPFLPSKRSICYLPWENEEFTPIFAENMRLMGEEVWTCSEFSRRAIAEYFPRCRVLPHLVERRKIAGEDRAWLQSYLREAGAERAFVFLSVQDVLNPRKNIGALLRAFVRLRAELGERVFLLLKQYRLDSSFDFKDFEGILSLEERLAPGRMDALYAGCAAYVSPHHAEGWGLGLSSAMAYGKIAIATGYSGNMEFMNARNSLLLPYRLAPVSARMCELVPLFTPEMRWAEPDEEALYQAMRKAALGRVDHSVPALAGRIVEDFGPERISARLAELLEEKV